MSEKDRSMVKKNDYSSESDDGSKTFSRRTALQATGVVLGGTQLFSNAAEAALESKKSGVEIIDSAEKANAIDLALSSEKVTRICDHLEATRSLSVSSDTAEVYRVSTKGGEYTVVSLFPRYPNQSGRAMETNVAVLLTDGVMGGINVLVSEYESRQPKWIYNYVIDGNNVKEIATKVSSAESGTLALNASTMTDVRGVAKSLLARFKALDINPGIAALPLLADVDPTLNQKTLVVASTIGVYGANDPGPGLSV